MSDWRWFKFRYVIRADGETWPGNTWLVWDSAFEKPVFTSLPMIEAYRIAVNMNLEIAHERQPA